MDWIDIAWPMLGAVSLTLGLIHLLIWLRQRADPAPLIFSLITLCVCALSVLELLMLKAATPNDYAVAVRWLHVPVAMMCVLLVLFVRVRFRAGRAWLGVTVYSMRLVSLVPNFLTGVNLNFREITSLARFDVWCGGTVAVPIGVPNPWMALAQLSNVLLVVFLIDATVAVWRRGNAEERRRVALLCGSIILFVISAAGWAVLMVMGWVQVPYSINIAFAVVVLAMSYELGGEALRATQLAHRLGESESNLRESRQRLKTAAHTAELVLWTWRIKSRDVWVTETGSALLGLAPNAELEREDFLTRIHPDDRQAVLHARDEAIHRTGEFICECRLPQPDGNFRWISAKGRVENTPAGEPDLMRGIILDITERRQAEERVRLVVESAPTAMLMIDFQGDVVLSNVQVERIFGYGRSELLGKPIEVLVPERLRRAYHAFLTSFVSDPRAHGIGSKGDLFGSRRDGGEVPVEIGLNPVRIGNDLFVLASIMDISDRLRVEQELAMQRAALAHLSRIALLGELSGSLAHELNQPLTAVLSNAQAALRFLDRESPALTEVHECLVRIVENDKRAGEVIRRLRAMLRKEQIDHLGLDINDVVQDVLRLVNSDLLGRKVSHTVDFATNLPVVWGDRVQLQQVLLNLVINACDAMDQMDKGRHLTIRTRLASSASVEVSISDVGPGIPTDDLERIFTPFVTSKPGGMGLGLPICRTIIQAHNGALWATSNSVRGATLHFSLPIEPGATP